MKRDKKDKKYKLNIKKDIVVPKGPPSNYKKGQLIGQGTLGKVHQCLSLNTGEIFVAKTISVYTYEFGIFRKYIGIREVGNDKKFSRDIKSRSENFKPSTPSEYRAIYCY